MNNELKRLLYILLIFISCVSLSTAQENKLLNRLDKRSQAVPVKKVFQDIEAAIAGGNIAAVAAFFGSQTYFSLTNGSSGYYSSNQAFYILENFFNVYQVRAFRFNNIQAGDGNPYATGIYTYELKGKRDTAQVYISLKPAGNNWKITQITIN